MKKVRSPLKQTINNLLEATDKSGKQYHISRAYKQTPNILNSTHEQQHKRNANSIKKVLKELHQLKKQLKGIKTVNRQEAIPQQLDNSKCRKLNVETKRSSPSPQHHSHSSSRNKAISQKRQTSTQTKGLNREVNQFSFSVHEKTNRSPEQKDSQEQDSVMYNPFSAKKIKLVEKKEQSNRKNIRSRQDLRRGKVHQQIESIEAAQRYEKHLNHLKNSFQILPISSNIYSSEDKLKLNIEMERMSNQIRRIPIYLQNPQQYYEITAMYARSLNNQLNNLAIILNRCDGREKLKERVVLENTQLNTKDHLQCKNCQENQKKDWERIHKKQIKKIEKEAGKIQTRLEKTIQDINILTTQNLILMKEKDEWKSRDKSFQARFLEEQGKVKHLKREVDDLELAMRDIESQRIKEIQKNKLQEEDLSYYKSQLEKLKKNVSSFREERNSPSKGNKQRKLQEHQIITELKDKQQLYQSIIRDKEALILELKKHISNFEEKIVKSNEKTFRRQDKSQNSSDSAEFYQLKVQIEEKNRLLAEQTTQIQHWKTKSGALDAKKNQLETYLEQCMSEINKLHAEIDTLEEANEKFKDRYLKTKVKNENKVKRQVETKSRKGQTFQEITELIQHHRKNIEHDINQQ